MDQLQHRFGGSEGDLHGAQIHEGQILQVAIQLRAVGLQPLTHLTDGGWSEAGSGSEGGGAVIGHPEERYLAAGGIAFCCHEESAAPVEQGLLVCLSHG